MKGRESAAQRRLEEKATLRIQALWRGYKARKETSPALRKRLADALSGEQRLRLAVESGDKEALARMCLTLHSQVWTLLMHLHALGLP